VVKDLSRLSGFLCWLSGWLWSRKISGQLACVEGDSHIRGQMGWVVARHSVGRGDNGGGSLKVRALHLWWWHFGAIDTVALGLVGRGVGSVECERDVVEVLRGEVWGLV
jgi:hypothetical protein